MSSESENPFLFKIALLGDEGTGKGKFIDLFTKNRFKEEMDAELGVISYKGSIRIDTEKGKQKSNIWIWDPKDNKSFEGFPSRYLEETQGIMLIFDLINRKSFDKLSNWIAAIKENFESEVPVVLIGNTGDSHEFVVSPTEINSIIRKFNLYYIETSLTTKEGVFDSFYCITSLSLGLDVNDEFFLTKEIVYYPTLSPAEPSPVSLHLTSQDLSNLGHKAIFEKIELLEEKIKKSMQIEISRKTILIEVLIAITVIILYPIQDNIYRYSMSASQEEIDFLVIIIDTILWISIGLQFLLIILIILSFYKRFKR
jgi:GTPase SAR1 family protein